jgi:transcriptional regulator NrdR family protein
MKYEVISKDQFKNLIKGLKEEIRVFDKLAVSEDSLADAVYEYLQDTKDYTYIRYELEGLLKNLDETGRFKLGVLLLLSSYYPFAFNLREHLCY